MHSPSARPNRAAMGNIENSMETKHNMDTIAENNENTIDSMETIIKIEDLTYTYPGAAQPTLNHVHLEIDSSAASDVYKRQYIPGRRSADSESCASGD